MILGLYLSTVAVASLTTGVLFTKTKKDLDKEGYKVQKEKITLPSILKETLGTLCGIIVPGLNVIYTAIIIGLKEDIYEGMKNTLAEKEVIQKEEVIINKNNISNDKTNIRPRRATNKRRYEELTREEKRKLLQKELSIIIDEKTNNNDGPKILKKTYNRNN